jgi:hypothetical protein
VKEKASTALGNAQTTAESVKSEATSPGLAQATDQDTATTGKFCDFKCYKYQKYVTVYQSTEKVDFTTATTTITTTPPVIHYF